MNRSKAESAVVRAAMRWARAWGSKSDDVFARVNDRDGVPGLASDLEEKCRTLAKARRANRPPKRRTYT